mmetsp:Transcript_5949/g.7781  ORF Transcript_5949/g.7781 Transcript_5949/m.7781 type:complete len:93 (+) Transcript_5949:1132-1410(+)
MGGPEGVLVGVKVGVFVGVRVGEFVGLEVGVFVESSSHRLNFRLKSRKCASLALLTDAIASRSSLQFTQAENPQRKFFAFAPYPYELRPSGS